MPGEPHHLPGIATAKLDQRLRRRNHLDEPAVVEHQGVAAAQRDRLRQIEQEFEATRAGHGHATPVAVVELQHDRIGGRVAPAVLALTALRVATCRSMLQRLTTLAGVMISSGRCGDTFIGADSSRHAFRCGAWPWASRSLASPSARQRRNGSGRRGSNGSRSRCSPSPCGSRQCLLRAGDIGLAVLRLDVGGGNNIDHFFFPFVLLFFRARLARLSRA